MNIDGLKPGPETDRLVAETIGDIFRPFRPSTTLNDAFWSEGQAGLFNEYFLTFDVPNRLWLIANWDAPFCSPHYAFIAADTPAMAVCHAILKLKVSKT